MDFDYDKLLDRVWEGLPEKLKKHERFEIPKAMVSWAQYTGHYISRFVLSLRVNWRIFFYQREPQVRDNFSYNNIRAYAATYYRPFEGEIPIAN